MHRRIRLAGHGPIRGAAATALVALAGCGSGQAAAPENGPATVPDVGELPAELSSRQAAPTTAATTTTTPAGSSTSTPSTFAPIGPYEGPIGRRIDGNRLLVIGDSIMASVSDRYGGQLCDRLEPLGWAVEVDAESGRDVTFGLDVLDERLEAGWDAAAIMLGNNYRGDPQSFADDLAEIVQRLAPRPTLLLTVTEFQASRAEVNYVIRSLARDYPHVSVVEWSRRSAEAAELLGRDGLHLSETGRVELADLVGVALNRVSGDGDCLDSDFDDDSAAPDVVESGGGFDDDDDSSGGDDGGGGGTPTTIATRPTSPPVTSAPVTSPVTAPPPTEPPPPPPPPPTAPPTAPPTPPPDSTP